MRESLDQIRWIKSIALIFRSTAICRIVRTECSIQAREDQLLFKGMSKMETNTFGFQESQEMQTVIALSNGDSYRPLHHVHFGSHVRNAGAKRDGTNGSSIELLPVNIQGRTARIQWPSLVKATPKAIKVKSVVDPWGTVSTRVADLPKKACGCPGCQIWASR